MRIILSCNAGSTNIKAAAFDAKTGDRTGHAILEHRAGSLTEWLGAMGSLDIAAIGHRIVHGGREFIHPVLIDSPTIEKLKALIPLAPLHQPASIQLIAEMQTLFPTVPQIACFDTAFHHSLPDCERRLPLPREYHDRGIQRYGFHGLSYQHIAAVLPQIAGYPATGRVIAAHLGGGSSACAMKDLQSVAITMGFSTLDGLMMGTRCGALDPGVVLHLLNACNRNSKDVEHMLYMESGLLGVSGISADMRTLLACDHPQAREAVELYCHLAVRQIASLLPALDGLDALVFTGGIGENAAPLRDRIVSQLRWVGDFAVYVIPADEETIIADACRTYLRE